MGQVWIWAIYIRAVHGACKLAWTECPCAESLQTVQGRDDSANTYLRDFVLHSVQLMVLFLKLVYDVFLLNPDLMHSLHAATRADTLVSCEVVDLCMTVV